MTTCRGIDVSAYQASQDWGARKTEGVVFAFAKASEGQTSRDSRFGAHIKGIKAAGLVPGAYHFGWPNQDPEREAANYIAAVKLYVGKGFVHWLDLERYSDGRNYRGMTDAQIKVWVETWLAAVRTAFPGQRVGVYTSADDVAKGHVPSDVPLWYPAYPWGPAAYSRAEAAAQPKVSGHSPLIWQFTSQPIDRSIAYMSEAGFRAWAAGTDQEDDMPTANEIATAVLKLDGVIAVPGAPATNPTWTLSSSVTEILKRQDKANATLAAQKVTIDKLVGAVATLAANVGDIDPATVVAELKAAIETEIRSIEIHLDTTTA